MQAKIIQIGNSKGLRLSKTLIEKYEFLDNVELVLKDSHIEVYPAKIPRQVWLEKFVEMRDNQDDELLIPDVFEDEPDIDEY